MCISALRVIFVNIKTSIQPFNLQCCQACEYFTTTVKHKKSPFFFRAVLRIICSVISVLHVNSFFFLFFFFFRFTFYGNDHNNLIWFVRHNKVRVWNKYGKGALNSDLRKRKSHCFFPSFAPLPTWQPDTANHSVRWPFSAIATTPPHHTCHGAKFPQL